MHPYLYVENLSRYPTGRVMDLIEFAVHNHDISDIGFTVMDVKKPTHTSNGTCWYGIPSTSHWDARDIKYVIDIYLGGPFPQHNLFWRKGQIAPYGGTRSPEIRTHTWEEATVRLAAHELMHAVQDRDPARRRNYEYKCEQYAYERLTVLRNAPSPAALVAGYMHTPPVPTTGITKGDSLWLG